MILVIFALVLLVSVVRGDDSSPSFKLVNFPVAADSVFEIPFDGSVAIKLPWTAAGQRSVVDTRVQITSSTGWSTPAAAQFDFLLMPVATWECISGQAGNCTAGGIKDFDAFQGVSMVDFGGSCLGNSATDYPGTASVEWVLVVDNYNQSSVGKALPPAGSTITVAITASATDGGAKCTRELTAASQTVRVSHFAPLKYFYTLPVASTTKILSSVSCVSGGADACYHMSALTATVEDFGRYASGGGTYGIGSLLGCNTELGNKDWLCPKQLCEVVTNNATTSRVFFTKPVQGGDYMLQVEFQPTTAEDMDCPVTTPVAVPVGYSTVAPNLNPPVVLDNGTIVIPVDNGGTTNNKPASGPGAEEQTPACKEACTEACPDKPDACTCSGSDTNPDVKCGGSFASTLTVSAASICILSVLSLAIST